MPCLDHKMELSRNIKCIYEKYRKRKRKKYECSRFENIDIGCVMITLVIPNVFFTVQSKIEKRKKNWVHNKIKFSFISASIALLP